jgi:hypothetical protein
MGLENQSGQALIEFLAISLIFVSLMMLTPLMIKKKNTAVNLYKISNEVQNEVRLKNEN